MKEELPPLEIKPSLRGIIHGIAFLFTLFSSLAFICTSFKHQFNTGILIYLLSQLLQYGVSSIYHIPAWSPKIKKIMRHLDHICIFVLISGTQTSVIVNSIGLRSNPIAALCIKLSWTISLIGILKILIMNKLHNIFDLVLYCVHGMIVAPFYKILGAAHPLDRILIYIGGILYLAGGLVYGLEKPDPYPYLFGFHEVFHVFTIAANMCFGVTISRRYIVSLMAYLLSPLEESFLISALLNYHSVVPILNVLLLTVISHIFIYLYTRRRINRRAIADYIKAMAK